MRLSSYTQRPQDWVSHQKTQPALTLRCKHPAWRLDIFFCHEARHATELSCHHRSTQPSYRPPSRPARRIPKSVRTNVILARRKTREEKRNNGTCWTILTNRSRRNPQKDKTRKLLKAQKRRQVQPAASISSPAQFACLHDTRYSSTARRLAGRKALP